MIDTIEIGTCVKDTEWNTDVRWRVVIGKYTLDVERDGMVLIEGEKSHGRFTNLCAVLDYIAAEAEK